MEVGLKRRGLSLMWTLDSEEREVEEWRRAATRNDSR